MAGKKSRMKNRPKDITDMQVAFEDFKASIDNELDDLAFKVEEAMDDDGDNEYRESLEVLVQHCEYLLQRHKEFGDSITVLSNLVKKYTKLTG